MANLQVEVIESRKDLYQACITGRTVYGSSRSGSSSIDSVYQLMVAIGPDVSAACLHPSFQFSSPSNLRLYERLLSLHAVPGLKECC